MGDLSHLSIQLAQLQRKIHSTKEYLESSNNLSMIINSGINSLESRKQHARDTMHMFEDVLQLRASYASVIIELEKGDLE